MESITQLDAWIMTMIRRLAEEYNNSIDLISTEIRADGSAIFTKPGDMLKYYYNWDSFLQFITREHSRILGDDLRRYSKYRAILYLKNLISTNPPDYFYLKVFNYLTGRKTPNDFIFTLNEYLDRNLPYTKREYIISRFGIQDYLPGVEPVIPDYLEEGKDIDYKHEMITLKNLSDNSLVAVVHLKEVPTVKVVSNVLKNWQEDENFKDKPLKILSVGSGYLSGLPKCKYEWELTTLEDDIEIKECWDERVVSDIIKNHSMVTSVLPERVRYNGVSRLVIEISVLLKGFTLPDEDLLPKTLCGLPVIVNTSIIEPL